MVLINKIKEIFFLLLVFNSFLFANNINNKIIEKLKLECNKGIEKACVDLFYKYKHNKQYKKALEVGLLNFQKNYNETLPDFADLLASDKTKFKNCKTAFLLLVDSIRDGNCKGLKILAKWYRKGICRKSPDLKKYYKYNNKYNKCLRNKK